MVKTEEQKRNTARFPGILQVRQRQDAEAFYLSKATTKTICGLFVRTETPLEKGVQVLTAINLPRVQDPIFIDCEVVWIKNNGNGNPAGMAVKFLKITERDRRVLDMYFRTKPKSQGNGAQHPQAAKPFTGQPKPLAQTNQA